MKLKASILAIALLGLMAFVPVAAHADESRQQQAVQPQTRLLTEQEMKEVNGAGKVCNVQAGCQRPCRIVATGIAGEMVSETDFYICGSNAFNPFGGCANTVSYICGHWVNYAGPCGSRGARTFAGNECALGCSGTPCTTPGYVGAGTPNG